MTDSTSTPEPDLDAAKASRIARLFDIRLVVGGLLSLYGLILLITGVVASRPAKSGGMHLNLWTGLGMLVVGLAMLAWMRLRPLEATTSAPTGRTGTEPGTAAQVTSQPHDRKPTDPDTSTDTDRDPAG